MQGKRSIPKQFTSRRGFPGEDIRASPAPGEGRDSPFARFGSTGSAGSGPNIPQFVSNAKTKTADDDEILEYQVDLEELPGNPALEEIHEGSGDWLNERVNLGGSDFIPYTQRESMQGADTVGPIAEHHDVSRSEEDGMRLKDTTPIAHTAAGRMTVP